MGSEFDKWELEECSSKREKLLSSKCQPFSQLLFSGAKMAALSTDVERARSWLLEGGELVGRDRSILLPPLSLPDYTKGEVFDRLPEC